MRDIYKNWGKKYDRNGKVREQFGRVYIINDNIFDVFGRYMKVNSYRFIAFNDEDFTSEIVKNGRDANVIFPINVIRFPCRLYGENILEREGPEILEHTVNDFDELYSDPEIVRWMNTF